MTKSSTTARKAARGPSRRGQRGQVAVTVALSIFALLLMLGLVLDLGHLYIAKTELQNAADACALSGVRELVTSRDVALVTAAGRTVGQMNNVNFQSTPVVVQDGDVTFSETLGGDFSRTITPATQYVRCEPRYEVKPWLGFLDVFTVPMSAAAIARMVPCAIPLAITTMGGGTMQPAVSEFGFEVGKWYEGRFVAGAGVTGNFNFVRFQGQGAHALADLIAGSGWCNIGQSQQNEARSGIDNSIALADPIADAGQADLAETGTIVSGEPGVNVGVAQAWNTRFGLYAGAYRDMTQFAPDRTGYAYTPNSWSSQRDAYDNFLQQRENYTPYNAAQAGLGNLPGNPAPLSSDLHRQLGQDRRMALAPIVDGTTWDATHSIRVLDWAYVLLLAPISDPLTDVRYEFRGLLSAGFPGGQGAGVPALVQ